MDRSSKSVNGCKHNSCIHMKASIMISFSLHPVDPASSSAPSHGSHVRLLSPQYEVDDDDSKNHGNHGYYGNHNDGYI